MYQDGFTVSIAEDQVTHTSADIIIYFIPIYHNRKSLAVASFMPTLLTLNQITKNKDLLIQSKIPTISHPRRVQMASGMVWFHLAAQIRFFKPGILSLGRL